MKLSNIVQKKSIKMNSNKDTIDMNRKTLLSTIWIFVLFNMVYADILGMLRPGYLELLDRLSKELSSGTVLLFAIMMEVVIVMVLLSRVLNYKANRWANFIAVPISILWVIVPALLPSLGEATPLSYIFFATVEVVAMSLIFWIAWKWPKQEA